MKEGGKRRGEEVNENFISVLLGWWLSEGIFAQVSAGKVILLWNARFHLAIASII